MVSLGGAVEASPHMPSLDYDGFLQATLAITRDMRDVDQAFRPMVFNFSAHSRDDYVRQHAYLMDVKGQWQLAPAFDLTFSHWPGDEHYMAVIGKGRGGTRDAVGALGAKHGIAPKRITIIIMAVKDAVSHWPRFAKEAGVQSSMALVSAGLDATAKDFASA